MVVLLYGICEMKGMILSSDFCYRHFLVVHVVSQASEKRESYHHMSGVRISSVDDAKAAADRRLVRGNRISNIWREGALCSEMGEKRGMCPLILPFQKWRETGNMAMAENGQTYSKR